MTAKEQLLRNRKALRHRIVACFQDLQPDRMILFGSVAQGRVDQWSDIDLILVIPTKKRFLDRLEDAYLRWTLPCAVDILVYTPEEFQKMVNEGNPFVCSALAHGDIIYERVGG